MRLRRDPLRLKKEVDGREFFFNDFFPSDSMDKDRQNGCSESEEKEGIEKGQSHFIAGS